jgi:hypothetical protein
MSKMIFYMALSTICISIELKSMERKRSNVHDLLNASAVAVSPQEIDAWKKELAKKEAELQKEHQQRIAALKVGMRSLAKEVLPQDIQKTFQFHNFSASQQARRGYEQNNNESDYTFEGVINLASDNA